MPNLFGHTRARVAARHALLTPDNHVGSSIPGIVGAKAVVLVNPAMGAGFSQVLVTFESGGGANVIEEDVETFGFVVAGGASVAVGPEARRLAADGFFFAPPGVRWTVNRPKAGTQLVFFQKKYDPLNGVLRPRAVFGDASKVKGAPFLGDPAAKLQVLLPDEPAFDLAVNLFAYEPGGHLPFVEVHIMEHGLLMLDGEGVYRLEDSWYPVRAGDAIWMAPYCAQWFAAIGKKPARYLYYKDVNRTPL